MPPGTILATAGTAAPAGYLLCDGSAVGRVPYAALFAVIGVTWGPGDGLTTFNLPDLRDRVLIGVSPGGLGGNRPTARVLAQTGGEEVHALAVNELAAHNHGVTDSGHAHPTADGSLFLTDGNGGSALENANLAATLNGAYTDTGLATTGLAINNTGAGAGHNTMQPFAVVNYIIKT